MKTIDEILNFEPQTTAIEYGAEPSLLHLLETYYLEHDIEPHKASIYVSRYVNALKEFVQENTK